MSKPDPIRRKKLSEEVQERLLEYIRTENLAPGDVLPSERELMALYQVGRPAIREAMQDLQRMGMIDIRHGERPKLAAPSLEGLIGQLGQSMQHLLIHTESSLDHLKQARLMFEVQMARIAAEKRTDQDVIALAAIVDAQDLARDMPEKFLDHDSDFHTRIAAISGNPIFETICQAIFGWMRVFHVEQVRKRGLESITLAEHRLILRAIADQAPQAAASAMYDHLTRANAQYNVENQTSSSQI